MYFSDFSMKINNLFKNFNLKKKLKIWKISTENLSLTLKFIDALFDIWKIFEIIIIIIILMNHLSTVQEKADPGFALNCYLGAKVIAVSDCWTLPFNIGVHS